MTNKGRGRDLILDEVEAVLDNSGYKIVDEDKDRPWGAYFKLDHKSMEDYLEDFFTGVKLPVWATGLDLDPKILIIAPETRLSWQYHERRGEVWRVLRGPVGVYVSDVDEMPEVFETKTEGANIQIAQGARHRLSGLDAWGIVAEMWVHTDPKNPSNEDDEIRLQDDFGRND